MNKKFKQKNESCLTYDEENILLPKMLEFLDKYPLSGKTRIVRHLIHLLKDEWNVLGVNKETVEAAFK